MSNEKCEGCPAFQGGRCVDADRVHAGLREEIKRTITSLVILSRWEQEHDIPEDQQLADKAGPYLVKALLELGGSVVDVLQAQAAANDMAQDEEEAPEPAEPAVGWN